MYEHHKQSIEKLLDYFKEDDDIIAIILGGSIAKGCERPDSDIDAIVVVNENKYMELNRLNKLTESIFGYCVYEKGYFDIKYCTEDYLKTLARKGSEPSRNAFASSKCLFSKTTEIEDLIKQIPVFQKQEKGEKLLSFYSAFSLNHVYFWGAAKDNIYLKIRAAADIVLFGLRLLLQEKEVLFPCHKALFQTVSNLENKPDNILEKATAFLSTLSDETKDDFVASIVEYINYNPPENYFKILTRYTEDNELWWYKDRPVIAEW